MNLKKMGNIIQFLFYIVLIIVIGICILSAALVGHIIGKSNRDHSTFKTDMEAIHKISIDDIRQE